MTPERIKKLEVLCQGPFGLELLAEVKRLQAELTEAKNDCVMQNAECGRLQAELTAEAKYHDMYNAAQSVVVRQSQDIAMLQSELAAKNAYITTLLAKNDELARGHTTDEVVKLRRRVIENNAEIQRLRKLARNLSDELYNRGTSWVEYQVTQKQIGSIEEDKPNG